MASKSEKRFHLVPCILALLYAGGFGPACLSEALAASSSVRSFECNAYTPGRPILVTIQVDPDAIVYFWAAEETPPAGWTVSDISHQGTYDAVNKKVKWGPFSDGPPVSRTLSYRASPPGGETGEKTFNGVASFDGINVTTTGSTSLSPDITPPSITCPPDLAPIAADANCQAVLPDVTAGAIATDNCDTAVTITQSPLAGTVIGIGDTVVTLTATDGAGNTETCTATVTVQDTTAPQITQCATNKTISADGTCQATVPDLRSEVVATDNCGGAVTITQSPSPGTVIGTGNTVVTLTATDGVGNTKTCTATVTVVNDPPAINQGQGPLALAVLPNSTCPGEGNQVDLSATDSDQDSSLLSWSVKTASVTGTVSFVSSSTGPSVTVCYKPNTGQTSSDSFVIQVMDLCGKTDEITINVTVSIPYHPADADLSWRIVIEEVTSYASCWKTGCTWPVVPNPIPIDYMTRSGYLWSIGELYHYDAGLNRPECWQPGVQTAQGAARRLSSQPDLKGSSAAISAPRSNKFSSSGFKTTAAVSTQALPTASQPNGRRVIEVDGEGTGWYKVWVETNPPGTASSWAVEERLPPGWNVRTVNEGGCYDAVNGKVKWGPFFDAEARLLSYAVGRPDGEQGEGLLWGVISADGQNKDIAGDRSIGRLDSDQEPNPPIFTWPCGMGIAGAFFATGFVMLAFCLRRRPGPWYK